VFSGQGIAMHFRQKKIENLGILEIVVSVALLKLYFVNLFNFLVELSHLRYKL
jgi:hypothetical protein